VTVIHHWADHRVSADNRVDSSWPSQRSQHAMKPDIRSESRFLSTPCAFDAPVGEGGFRQNIAITFGTEKIEWCRYPKVKKFEDIFFILTECTNVTDTRTDRRTDT